MDGEQRRGDVLARILGGIGRTLITAGVIILLFVAYQLWGTGIRTAQAQNALEDDFAAALEAADGAVVGGVDPDGSEGGSEGGDGGDDSTTSTTGFDPSTTTTRLPATTAPPLTADALPAQGAVAGQIQLPTIGADWYFVEGVSVANLKEGPGHYPETPFPGQAGNASIAGHRTTYGAPFANVDQLKPGDEITVTTVQGRFTYLVRETVVVDPSQVEVLGTDYWSWDNALTLTACHPKYSARQRIIIGAELVGEPLAPTPRVETAPTEFEPSLSGERAGAWPAIVLGLICGVLWLVAWAVGKRRRALKWHAYAVGIGPFLVLLYFFFENFSRLLPANY